VIPWPEMHQSNLKRLLNDESFIRWLKNEETNKEQQRWDHWLGDDFERQIIVRKAKKIVTMPFMEKIPLNVEKQLQVLQKKIEKLGKN
jgi:hypothetical protein